MDIKNWLIQKISEESNIDKNRIDCNEIFDNFNLDEINPSVFTEFNTINKLSEWILEQK